MRQFFLFIILFILVSHIFFYCTGINSGDENKEITATHAARKILSRERNPPIDILINANVVPKLVEFLCRVNKYVASLTWFQNYFFHVLML